MSVYTSMVSSVSGHIRIVFQSPRDVLPWNPVPPFSGHTDKFRAILILCFTSFRLICDPFIPPAICFIT